jgi:antitoxin component of MazEF toxin-antitoxin module
MPAKKKTIKKTIPIIGEPEVEYAVRTSFRSVGNSKGLIISSKLIEASGIHGNDLIIEAANGIISIREVNSTDVNTDLSTWDKQFKSALKNGCKVEGDLFDGMKNEFDEEEW